VPRRLALVPVLLAAVVAAPGAGAASGFDACSPNGLQCATLSVPLDHSGATAGQVPLYVEELPATGTPRGVMLMLAGGPGQASAETFDLAKRGAYWQSYFPGYTLVAYDDRGTGKSGALDCSTARTIEDCAGAIPGRAFYTTRDHAEDIESVRLALGVDKLAIFGVSYGTKHAVAYALAHPSHVERLLLDSELLPDRDILGTDSLRAIPGSVNGICAAGACPTLPSNLGGQFATLANKLVNAPLIGNVNATPAGTVAVRIDGSEMLALAYESDLSTGISSQLPAALDAAIRGWPLPLERLAALDDVLNNSLFTDISVGLYYATTCGDGPFPWSPNDPAATREAALNAAINALPPGATGPFGSWTLNESVAWPCVFWPAPSGGAALAPGPLPDVPALVLSGDRDIRTPTSSAVAIAARFPHGRVLVVPGSGHSVLNRSDCAANAVRGWLDGSTPPAVCTRLSLGVPPLARWTHSVAAMRPVAHVVGALGRTLAAVVQTLHDAEDAWLLGRQSSTTIDGLVGGRMVPDPTSVLRLQGYSSVGGLALSGTIVLKLGADGQPVVPLQVASGSLQVSGKEAGHGSLRARGNRLTGTLAGRPVSVIF
jgi:pimeloyl-ACP methyl ester carboxylesterase